MIWSFDESAVVMVKASVTALPVASGTRSAAAMIHETPRTRTFIKDPDGAPALTKSLLVLTVMPVAFPAVAGPNVTPIRVTTCAPAAKLLSTRMETEVGKMGCKLSADVDPIIDG